MRAFTLQSPQVPGTVALQYNQQGRLIAINTADCELSLSQLRSFLKVVPITLNDLQNGIGLSATTVVIEQDIVVGFDEFWNKYDKKINRKRSEQLWQKMSNADKVLALYHIDAYDKYLRKEKWRTKADPDTYLRNRYFENEYTP